MLQKFLKESMSVVVGKQGEEIVDLLDSKKYVNEFLIAKKLDITINQTRNILYKVSDHGLVSSIRKKDKKKGWYTYFWKIEILKSLQFLKDTFSKKITQLEYYIKSRETKQFYVCERCNIEFSEENALLHNFICEECGSIFSLRNNTKLVGDLKKELEKLGKQRRFIDEEIQKEKEKMEKIKKRALKKEEKEKKAARKKKKIIRKKLLEKKQKVKKKRKKKVVKKKKKITRKKPKKISKKKPLKKSSKKTYSKKSKKKKKKRK